MKELYEKVEEGLSRVMECPVYREQQPEEAAHPCFVIGMKSHKAEKGVNGRMKHSVNVEIRYLPERDGPDQWQEECWGVCWMLMRGLTVSGFKMKNRNAKTGDKELHMVFDAEYQEYSGEEAPCMEKLSQSTTLKEESFYGRNME